MAVGENPGQQFTNTQAGANLNCKWEAPSSQSCVCMRVTPRQQHWHGRRRNP